MAPAHSHLPLMHMPALAHDARPKSQLYYDFTTDTTSTCDLNCADYFGKKNVWTGPGGQGWPPKVYRPPVEDECSNNI